MININLIYTHVDQSRSQVFYKEHPMKKSIFILAILTNIFFSSFATAATEDKTPSIDKQPQAYTINLSSNAFLNSPKTTNSERMIFLARAYKLGDIEAGKSLSQLIQNMDFNRIEPF